MGLKIFYYDTTMQQESEARMAKTIENIVKATENIVKATKNEVLLAQSQLEVRIMDRVKDSREDTSRHETNTSA